MIQSQDAFLEQTQEYYTAEGARLMGQLDIADYLLHAEVATPAAGLLRRWLSSSATALPAAPQRCPGAQAHRPWAPCRLHSHNCFGASCLYLSVDSATTRSEWCCGG